MRKEGLIGGPERFGCALLIRELPSLLAFDRLGLRQPVPVPLIDVLLGNTKPPALEPGVFLERLPIAIGEDDSVLHQILRRIPAHLPDDSWRDTIESLELLMEPEGLSHFFSGHMRLGIVGGNLTEQMGDFLGVPGKRGILIMEVRPTSAAERSGLKAGDVIESVDRRAVVDSHDLSQRLINSTHELEIVREKQIQQVQVEVNSVSGDRKRSLHM